VCAERILPTTRRYDRDRDTVPITREFYNIFYKILIISVVVRHVDHVGAEDQSEVIYKFTEKKQKAAAMASLISGAMNSAAWTGAGMIPVFVVGLAYLRYSMYDPESRVVDVQEVNITFIYTLTPLPGDSRSYVFEDNWISCSGFVVVKNICTGCTGSPQLIHFFPP